MTKYEQDTLNLLNGDTPKQRYETMKNIIELLDNISMPRRGSDAESWTIYDVSRIIEEKQLIKREQ